jgi:hypothetical protein
MRHILEIPQNVVTAFFTMRDENGSIYSGVAKGEPHYTESLAISFGAFVAIVQAIESMDGPESKVAKDLRDAMQEQTLEQSRQMLTDIAAATRAFLDDQEEGGAE